MDATTKRGLLYSLALVAMMTALLGAGLPSLTLERGIPLPERGSGGGSVPALLGQDDSISFPINELIIKFFIGLVLLVLLVAIFLMLRGLAWKTLWRGIAKTLLGCAAIVALLSLLYVFLPRSGGSLASAPPPPPHVIIRHGSLGQSPKILIWFLSFVTLGLAAFLGYRLLTPKPAPPAGMDLVRLEAEATREVLLGGGNFRDAITLCYRRMARALEAERGIEKRDSMTAREFEELLEESGVPRESVHALTSLFEAVRYGKALPSPADEGIALRCLEDIEAYARSGGSR
jgi:hypothetical protein